MDSETPWWPSHRADQEARLIADRHYNRQKVGSRQFVPPGRCLVLKAEQALWVTSWPFAEYVKHAWPGAWVNSAFRREGGEMVASEMILHAVAHTRHKWPDVPELGMVTFVDPSKVARKRDPGRCYKYAGFKRDGSTKGGLVAWRLAPEDMPPPSPPNTSIPSIFATEATP